MKQNSERLLSLLNDGTRYDPHYIPSMNSDHLPMTLCAIHGLGGSDQSLEAYRKDYSKILREAPEARPLSNWHEAVGDREQYPALLNYFKKEISVRGLQPTVKEYLPEFLPGMAMEAFHPVIRLGYALDFGSASETAAGLAYLVSSHRDVPIDASIQIDIRAAMNRQVEEGPRTFESSRFGQSIVELLDCDCYPMGTSLGLEDCAGLALDVYLATRNFFALHLVTVTQAVRVCSSVVGEEQVLAPLTGAILAAHLVLGSPSFKDPLPPPKKLDREHVYKYAWACLSEYRYYGDNRYAQELREFRQQGLIPEWSAENEIP